MKIVCDSCGAKYSIADEKVAGKVFKIRCKKCSSTIVVRGDQVPNFEDDDGATRVYDYGSEAIWHVVVDGDQQGPMAPAAFGALLTDGTIDWDAYVWREGFEGWKAARDVPELVEAVSGGAPAAEEAPA
ncbi:MAG: GYF domain-containing protein, partial [Myxococcota bacterium]